MNLGKVVWNVVQNIYLTLSIMLLMCVIVGGCTLLDGLPSPTATGSVEDETTNPTPSRGGKRWTDASDVMTGVCFEAADDASGRVFVIRSSAELDTFFGLADNSQLCRHAVQRGAFDFGDGRVLAGVWSAGFGCVARHNVDAFERDNEAKTIVIRLTLVIEGNCPYELVRPFWVGIPNAQEHDITITVEGASATGATAAATSAVENE